MNHDGTGIIDAVAAWVRAKDAMLAEVAVRDERSARQSAKAKAEQPANLVELIVDFERKRDVIEREGRAFLHLHPDYNTEPGGAR